MIEEKIHFAWSILELSNLLLKTTAVFSYTKYIKIQNSLEANFFIIEKYLQNMETQQTIAEIVQPATEKTNLNDELKAKVTTRYLNIEFYCKRHVKKPLIKDKVFIFYLPKIVTIQPKESVKVNRGIKIHLPKKIEQYGGILLSFRSMVIVKDLSNSIVRHESKDNFHVTDLLNINVSKRITIRKRNWFILYVFNK